MSAIARRCGRYEGLLLGVAGLGLTWEAAARLEVIDPAVLASPGRVGPAVARQWRAGELPADLAVSAAEFALSAPVDPARVAAMVRAARG